MRIQGKFQQLIAYLLILQTASFNGFFNFFAVADTNSNSATAPIKPLSSSFTPNASSSTVPTYADLVGTDSNCSKTCQLISNIAKNEDICNEAAAKAAGGDLAQILVGNVAYQGFDDTAGKYGEKGKHYTALESCLKNVTYAKGMIASQCAAVQGHDKTIETNRNLAIAYGTAGGVCLGICMVEIATGGLGAVADGACLAADLAVSSWDLAESIKLTEDGSTKSIQAYLEDEQTKSQQDFITAATTDPMGGGTVTGSVGVAGGAIGAGVRSGGAQKAWDGVKSVGNSLHDRFGKPKPGNPAAEVRNALTGGGTQAAEGAVKEGGKDAASKATKMARFYENFKKGGACFSSTLLLAIMGLKSYQVASVLPSHKKAACEAISGSNSNLLLSGVVIKSSSNIEAPKFDQAKLELNNGNSKSGNNGLQNNNNSLSETDPNTGSGLTSSQSAALAQDTSTPEALKSIVNKAVAADPDLAKKIATAIGSGSSPMDAIMSNVDNVPEGVKDTVSKINDLANSGAVRMMSETQEAALNNGGTRVPASTGQDMLSNYRRDTSKPADPAKDVTFNNSKSDVPGNPCPNRSGEEGYKDPSCQNVPLFSVASFRIRNAELCDKIEHDQFDSILNQQPHVPFDGPIRPINRRTKDETFVIPNRKYSCSYPKIDEMKDVFSATKTQKVASSNSHKSLPKDEMNAGDKVPDISLDDPRTKNIRLKMQLEESQRHLDKVNKMFHGLKK